MLHKVPIVSPSWLHASVDQGRLVNTTEHHVPPFQSLRICVTGFAGQTRADLVADIQRYGGTYEPNLHPHCTHLLCASAEGR